MFERRGLKLFYSTSTSVAPITLKRQIFTNKNIFQKR